jgi:hypothetical protein
MAEKPPEIAVKIAGLVEANASGWLGIVALVLIVTLVVIVSRQVF